uniref:Actin related protein 1B n=1 Tax=Paramormyrops kingsleyae TaxID=1676925 RepID=A0A3B3T100_9TELE
MSVKAVKPTKGLLGGRLRLPTELKVTLLFCFKCPKRHRLPAGKNIQYQVLYHGRLVMESYDIIANQPVVIDNGSGVIKAGFAGDQIPKYCFPNYVGRPKHVRVMAGALEGDLFIGPKAEEHRGLLSVRYPMEHGIVKDWNDMERIWQYVYSKEQLQTFSEEHPVLLTEAPLNPSKNRERAAEVFFETFNVPALFISMQAVLSLYATGRTTGVVLDAGDGVTHAVPIYEGFAIPHSIMRVDIAGRDVSRYLRLLLRKEGYDFHTSAEFEVVRTIKERACYLSLNPQKDETLETEKAQYTLPDGSALDIGPARFRAPELLFRPDLIGDESEGIHEVLAFAIQKSDLDLRRTLFSNIVLSGGSTLLKGGKHSSSLTHCLAKLPCFFSSLIVLLIAFMLFMEISSLNFCRTIQ